MRKLLSLIALSCAMAIAFGANVPQARAAVLMTNISALKAEQSATVQQARYRCWWRNGYRHCGYRHHRWNHRYGYHHGWRHRHWRDRYWRHRYYYRHHQQYRRHYYYNSYQPAYRRHAYPRYGYCIGVCWW
ncbi:hypothetical protein [Hyphomicrobium facile]|uniref:YXWGXW repeat-containing protein n=1 Tax=Hyphomicrobium facile TaxID=51670 RepID=A0A1I7NEY6_9HYPH|nr:hypothetical protein [Hyphomicrobium facile]SFV33225.1 hypothetical protein SAMN04488557_1883 [Hyphomicrobium facile]